jgi:hypothetical protein
MTISFARDVLLKSIGLSQFGGATPETAVIELVSGDNPFTDLSGYEGGEFELQDDSLSISRVGNGNNVAVQLGTLDQDELWLTAGTEISITANPATDGGVVVRSINVAIPDFLVGDVNLDGVVNLLDVNPFVQRISSGGYQMEADVNKDGVTNLLDVASFVGLLSAG